MASAGRGRGSRKWGPLSSVLINKDTWTRHTATWTCLPICVMDIMRSVSEFHCCSGIMAFRRGKKASRARMGLQKGRVTGDPHGKGHNCHSHGGDSRSLTCSSPCEAAMDLRYQASRAQGEACSCREPRFTEKVDLPAWRPEPAMWPGVFGGSHGVKLRCLLPGSGWAGPAHIGWGWGESRPPGVFEGPVPHPAWGTGMLEWGFRLLGGTGIEGPARPDRASMWTPFLQLERL